jgi:hypothetical protein
MKSTCPVAPTLYSEMKVPSVPLMEYIRCSGVTNEGVILVGSLGASTVTSSLLGNSLWLPGEFHPAVRTSLFSPDKNICLLRANVMAGA